MDRDLQAYLQAQEARKNQWIAGILQFVLPGAGYLYLGKYVAGAFMLLIVFPMYFLLWGMTFGIGGFIVGLLLFFNAVSETRKYNKRALAEVAKEATG